MGHCIFRTSRVRVTCPPSTSCLECGHSFSSSYANTRLRHADTELRRPGGGLDLVQHLEQVSSGANIFMSLPNIFQWLHSQAALLHPHHHTALGVKRRLGALYGNCAPYEYAQLTRPQLERKLQLCGEVTAALARVDPGISRWRQAMTREVNKAKLVLALRQQQLHSDTKSLL